MCALNMRQDGSAGCVVNRPADQLWGEVRDFWQESGFLLTSTRPAWA
jgi:outer membrane protein assembly factor BamC